MSRSSVNKHFCSAILNSKNNRSLHFDLIWVKHDSLYCGAYTLNAQCSAVSGMMVISARDYVSTLSSQPRWYHMCGDEAITSTVSTLHPLTRIILPIRLLHQIMLYFISDMNVMVLCREFFRNHRETGTNVIHPTYYCSLKLSYYYDFSGDKLLMNFEVNNELCRDDVVNAWH